MEHNYGTKFFVILDHFLPFYLPNNLKNQTFEKMKKKQPLDTSSFYTCAPKIMITKNYDHIMTGS